MRRYQITDTIFAGLTEKSSTTKIKEEAIGQGQPNTKNENYKHSKKDATKSLRTEKNKPKTQPKEILPDAVKHREANQLKDSVKTSGQIEMHTRQKQNQTERAQ